MDKHLLTLFSDLRTHLSRGIDEVDLPFDRAALTNVMAEVATRLDDNYPYFDPLYAGQMLKPPHQIAQLAYSLALGINPNNHALDGGRASSAMEKEVIAELAKSLFHWKNPLGHLTGGGTIANLEALWIARELTPNGIIVASELAHYTHERMSGVLGIPFRKIPCNDRGELLVDALEAVAATEKIALVVATMGTTSVASVDPLPQILELRRRVPFRIHGDAAYGGYFALANNLTPIIRSRFAALSEVDSIVIDPHKHGLQPYGCGCILFRDPSVGRFYQHDSPYTYFTSDDLHLGEISLECSRAGAAAVALWATMKLFPLRSDGELAKSLDRSHEAALKLYQLLHNDPRFVVGNEPTLDIVTWGINSPDDALANHQAQSLFERCAKRGLHLALTKLPPKLLNGASTTSASYRNCLRSCLMKYRHLDYISEIYRIVSEEMSALS